MKSNSSFLKSQKIDQSKTTLSRKLVYMTLEEAQANLDNFTFTLAVNKKEPTYGDITFIHQDIRKFS